MPDELVWGYPPGVPTPGKFVVFKFYERKNKEKSLEKARDRRALNVCEMLDFSNG